MTARGRRWLRSPTRSDHADLCPLLRMIVCLAQTEWRKSASFSYAPWPLGTRKSACWRRRSLPVLGFGTRCAKTREAGIPGIGGCGIRGSGIPQSSGNMHLSGHAKLREECMHSPELAGPRARSPRCFIYQTPSAPTQHALDRRIRARRCIAMSPHERASLPVHRT